TIAVTGGGDNQQFRLSLSDLRSKSVMPNAGFDRTNVNLSTNGKYGERFTVTGSIMYSKEGAKNRPRLSDSPGNANLSVYYMPPNIDVTDFYGDPDKPGAIYEGQTNPGTQARGTGEELGWYTNQWSQNPYWVAYQFENSDWKDRIISSGLARIDITDWLYAHARYGMDWQTKRTRDVTPFGTGYQRSGSLTESEYRISETNAEWVLGMDKMFGDIGINAFVGGNAMRSHYERLILSASNFNIPFFHTLSNGKNQSVGLWFSETGINSLFFSAEVNYNGYLFLTATGRNDWFSTLNPETNSVFYPSVGISYVLSDMVELPAVVTFAKARASWAQVGGATGAYKTALTYSLAGQGHLGMPLGQINQSAIPNPNLVPLTSSETEMGLDMRFYDNRVGVDFTYYRQKTTDDILDATVTGTTGFSGTTQNIGEMQNNGIEVLLSGTPIKQQDFDWEVSFNFAKNNNKVVKITDQLDRLQVGEPRTRQAYIQHIEGFAYSAIMARAQEVDGQGRLVYDSATGFPTIADTLLYYGSGVHNFTGGIMNTINYKNFSLSFLIDFKTGGYLYSGTNVRLVGTGLHQMTLEGREGDMTRTGVEREGGEERTWNYDIDQARGYWGRYDDISGNFVYDASFAKLRHVTVGYNFPQSILSKTPLSRLSLSFVARNLAILYNKIENIDPESNYSNDNAQGLDYFGFPGSRTYGFNLRAIF
ncbi:MAG: TonB-dependent receptor, partial [Cyclobacteriaceae bacterium]|nr:TonB-dependent receptor [Cyclobacteriaceae bacterium]